MEQKEGYLVPILHKGFALLEYLGRQPGGRTMAETLADLDFPKTTLFRLLAALTEEGYICLDPETGRYTLSRRLLRLGLAALGEAELVEYALQPMRALRDRVRESVMLGVFMDNRVVLLEQVLGSHNFTFILKPGTDFCLHASAPGKLFLALLSDKEREEALQTVDYQIYTPNTFGSREALEKELEKIRTLGYATDDEEEMQGVNCLAAPVFNSFGEIAAALWTSGPSGRLTRESFPDMAVRIIEAADAISLRLGFKRR
ncbi:IclR family transcriptional regulator [Millionella massiliensis]|uniref:IclR family transcriptional regulator n=1 Tax=Millionella massiliensis TaxID=1871023 RepID=UPI0008DA1DA2|nr:IclR family transcriptional regulator [Millionella massiliensis]